MIKQKKINSRNILVFLMIILNSYVFAYSKTLSEENINLIEKAISLVDKEYIEETKQDELIESALNGMLQSLDPHSVYLPPKEFVKSP